MDHPGVNCDLCNRSIKGNRYKCLECDDFDLCHLCESNYHLGHVLCRFTAPTTQSDKEFLRSIAERCPRDKPFLIQGYHDGEKCNICGSSYIVGFLYKCVDCPNFNVCRRCEKRDSKCVAGKDHFFFRFADPLSLNSFNKRFWQEILEIRSTTRNVTGEQGLISTLTSELVKHGDTKCDDCNNDVVGVRFKCIDCQDFDLCSCCEPKNLHAGHLLVRFGKPLELEAQTFLGKIVKIRLSKQSRGVVRDNRSNPTAWATNHCGISCDNCDNKIHGFRYKCLDCRDFDLCSFCQKKRCHTEHLMIRFTEPLNQNILNQQFIDAIMKSKGSAGTPMQELSRTMCRKNVMEHTNKATSNTRFSSSFTQNHSGTGRAIQNCTVCYMMPSEIMLLDCGHLCICSDCIDGYMRSSQQCPICRNPIKSTHRAYY